MVEKREKRSYNSDRRLSSSHAVGRCCALLIVLVLILLCALLYLLCLCPNRGRQDRMRPFEETYIAHRGLHDNPSIPENSLPAFRRALEAGYGIELDVQLTTDDRLVVFHDETLKRVCGDDRTLHELSYDELSRLRLFGTDESIPLLRDVLDEIGGRVPLVVEIKSEGRYTRTTELTCGMLQDYRGEYCVESFHPLVLRRYRELSPQTLRGQLSTNYKKEHVSRPSWQRFLLTNLLLNSISRPDFIAYDRQYANQFSFRLCRKLYRPVNVAWTVKNEQQLDEARELFDAFIFDSFIPTKNDSREDKT